MANKRRRSDSGEVKGGEAVTVWRRVRLRAAAAYERAGPALRVVLLVYAALTLVVVRLHPMHTGLDPSWAVGLNYFRHQGLVHGRDIAFTYGPLSFLTLPMDVGTNLAWGAAFQVLAWLLFATVLARVVWRRAVSAGSLAIFALTAYFGVRSFHTFGYVGPDVFVAYLALLLLGAALEGPRWRIYYGLSIATAALLTLIKWSTGMNALSAILAFPIGWLVLDRRKALEAAAIGFGGAPLSLAAAYLLYNPSVTDMLRYWRAGFEISAGHSAAQSTPIVQADLTAALLFAGVYAGFLGALWWLRQPSFVLGFALLGPLFIEFKHSFIRYAGHADIYFYFLPLAVGLVFLFTRLEGRSRWLALALIPMILAVRYRGEGDLTWRGLSGAPGGVARAKALLQTLRWESTRRQLAAVSQAELAADRLPRELLERVGGSTITVYPWECSYAAANPIRFVPLPVFSGFMAYTEFLDEWNAAFLGDGGRAPAYFLFEWKSIDDRNPLLDSPQTFAALYRHYDFDSQWGERVLLKRRQAARFGEGRLVKSETVAMGAPIRLRGLATAHPTVAQVHIPYNLSGRAMRFLLQIPEMRATYNSGAGGAVSYRFSTETAGGGLPLNFLPTSLAETVELFRNERLLYPAGDFGEPGGAVRALAVSGAGRGSYEQELRVDFYEFPEARLGEPSPPAKAPALDGLQRISGAEQGGLASRIEFLGGRGVTEYGPSEVIELADTHGVIEAAGWAVDIERAAPAGSVWLRMDGKLFAPGEQGLDRRDIAVLLGGAAFQNCGFRWFYPAWALGSAEHSISLVVLSRDGLSYQEATPRRFRVVAARN